MSLDETEQWLGLVAYPGYEASSHGRVRSNWKFYRPSILAPTPWLLDLTNTNGYPKVSLRLKSGRYRRCFVHRLVLEAFVGPCPEGMEGCHFPDPNPENCRLHNLRWATHQENSNDRWLNDRDGFRNAIGEGNPKAKLDASKVKEIFLGRRAGRKLASIRHEYGITDSVISKIARRKIWKHVTANL